MKTSIESAVRLQTAKTLKSNFYLFFLQFWDKISSDKFVYSKHIEYICNELQILGEKIIKREKPDFDWYIINVPPGSSKSTIVSIMFPTWLLTNDPSLFITNTSYSSDLAVSFIRKSKNVIDSPEYQFLFDKIELTKDNEGYIETKQSGGRYATSTGGTVTGTHANVLISDDPESAEQSRSEAFRNTANRYITETLSTRKRDKEITPIILIMQRLHELDPTGYLLAKKLNIKHICLPAIADGSESNKSLYVNGLLDPIRMNENVLNNYRSTLGSYGFAGQFMQKPAPDEGGKIKREWFEIVNESDIPQHLAVNCYIDGAYTKNTTNDPTGLMPCVFHNNILYIKHWSAKYFEMPELLRYFKEYAEIHKIGMTSRIRIEPKASGLSLKQLIFNETRFNVSEIIGKHVSESKVARVDACSPTMEAGRVKLLKGAWNEDFLTELAIFPNGKHDEAVDCLCYAIYDYFVQVVRRPS